MKCKICNKDLRNEELVYVHKNPEKLDVYCEEHQPEDRLAISPGAALNVIAGRKNMHNKVIKKTLGEWAYQQNIRLLDTSFYEDKKLYTIAEYTEIVPREVEVALNTTVIQNNKEEESSIIESQTPEILSEEEKVELKLELELTSKTSAKLDFGYEDLKEKVLLWRNQNLGTVITEDNFSDMKDLDKEAAKEAKKINDFKVAAKKSATANIVEFENNCKELIGYIDEVRGPWKEQFDVFAEKEREDKKKKVIEIIEELYATHEILEENRNIEVTDRHLLKSTTFKAIREDVESKCIELKNRQEEEKQRELEAKAQKQTQIDYINLMVGQEERNNDVHLNKQKYLDQLELGTDVKIIVGAIVKDAQDILTDRENQEQKRKEAAEKSFEESVNEPYVEIPNIVKNGEVYDGSTGEYVGNDTDVFEERNKQELSQQTEPQIKKYKLTFEVTSDVTNLKLLSEYLKSNPALNYVRLNTEEVE